MMAGKENSAMTILMDFAKPCKGKLIGSVVLAVLGGTLRHDPLHCGVPRDHYDLSRRLCFQQVGVSGIDCSCGLSRAGVVRNVFYNEEP